MYGEAEAVNVVGGWTDTGVIGTNGTRSENFVCAGVF